MSAAETPPKTTLSPSQHSQVHTLTKDKVAYLSLCYSSSSSSSSCCCYPSSHMCLQRVSNVSSTGRAIPQIIPPPPPPPPSSPSSPLPPRRPSPSSLCFYPPTSFSIHTISPCSTRHRPYTRGSRSTSLLHHSLLLSPLPDLSTSLCTRGRTGRWRTRTGGVCQVRLCRMRGGA